jgi:hypothetical protein
VPGATGTLRTVGGADGNAVEAPVCQHDGTGYTRFELLNVCARHVDGLRHYYASFVHSTHRPDALISVGAIAIIKANFRRKTRRLDLFLKYNVEGLRAKKRRSATGEKKC